MASAQVCGAHRHDHELLDVDGVVGMRAAVDDVHHRHGQQVRVGAAEIAIERQPARLRRRLGHRQRHAEDGVGAEPALVGRAVELDQRVVDAALVLGVHAGERIEDLAVDGVDRLEHALAEVALLVAVAQLDGLVRAGRGAGGHRRRGRSAPSSSTTSTSTVGLPRLSRISRPMMSTMAVMELSLSRWRILALHVAGRRSSLYHRAPKAGKHARDGRMIKPGELAERRNCLPSARSGAVVVSGNRRSAS